MPKAIREKNKIENEVEKYNASDDTITIRTKPKAIGGFTVYLDYWIDGKRKVKNLPKELSLIGTSSELMKDRAKIKQIVTIRDKKQVELLEIKTSTKSDSQIDFFIFFEEYIIRDKNYKRVLIKLKAFHKMPSLQFSDINRKFCMKFADFLNQRNILGSSNTANSYFQMFKAILNRAVNSQIIDVNPAKGITIKKTDTKKEYLTIDELRILKRTPKPHNEICNAFLFSCFTGLRVSDIRALAYENFRNNTLHFMQIKTKRHEILPLSEQAIAIINEQAENRHSDFIFNVGSDATTGRVLKKWVNLSGINKKITFHSSRVTAAVLYLSQGIPIYDVSKLLGHTSVAVTEIYSRLTIESKKNAMDVISKIEF